MTGTVQLYLTPEGWLTPEIDSLIRSLIETSPDDVAIIVSTSELKQVLVGHTTSDATIQAFPHISTLDDWVVGASGISVRRGPLLEAAARALALSRLESSHPELISFLTLTGIWNRLSTLANLAIMHTLPAATLDRIAHQWFPSVNRLNIRSVIAAIQEARDEIGIRDQQFAYRYGQREQWQPLQRGSSSTLVFLGFTDPLPAERDVLRTLISAHPFSVVVVPDTTYPSDGTRDWMALLRAFPHVQEIDIRAARVPPALTVWQPETSDEEIALLVQLIRSAGTPDVGIALAQFDALHVPLATALGHAGIPVANALGTPLGDTLPGRMVAATAAAISGGFRVRDVLDWLDTRRHCPKPCGYTAADIVTTHNRLIQQGILDIDPWPSGTAHSESVPDLWAATQALLGQTIDTIGIFSRTLDHPNRSHWNPSATREWGAVFQLIGEWDTIRTSLPIDTQLSVLLEGLRGTKSPAELTTGIRICSLQHAAMVPADIWIVPSATDSCFPPPDHSLGNVTLPGEPAIPTIDMRVNAHQRWIHWLLGQTRRDLHICGPRTIAGEPQVISGAVTTALATAQVSYQVIVPRLPAPDTPQRASSPLLIPEMAPPATVSASQLEAYQNCPRHYYLNRYLRLNPPPNRTIDLDPDEQGQLLHRIAGECILYLQAQQVSPDDLHQKAVHWLETEGFRDVRQLRGGQLAPLIHRRLIGTLEAPGLLRLAIPSFISFVQDFKIIEVESPFEWTLPDSDIRLKGRIDLIAVHRESQKRVIVDFKTGTTAITKIALETLSHLQLPIYRLALLSQNLAVDAGIIWILSRQKIERKTVMVTPESKAILVPKRQQPMIITPTTDHAVLDRIKWIIDQIAAGHFPVTGIPELARQEQLRPETVCRHCPFILSCPFSTKWS